MAENDYITNLEKILEKTVNVLEESKKDIFSIAENSRQELKNVESELELVNEQINQVINKIDNLEQKNRRARLRLMKVSKDIHNYTEADIKEAYEEAEETSVEIAVMEEKEEQLKNRRSELEDRLVNLKNTLEKAENLVSKVGVVREYLQGKLTDLSEHFDDLRQKQQVVVKIIQAQEEERKRVAREIHDGPAQSMANLVFRVELAQELLDKDLDQAREELGELKDQVRSSVQDVRKIIYDLRPMSLDDLGLVPTLKRYIDRFIKQTGINIELQVRGDTRRLPDSYEVTIFRLIQEALNNIYKHARATSGRVNLEFTRDQINLLISDDGQGFDVDKVEENSFGLVNLRERCDLLGGELEITSSKERGTRIYITIPLKTEGMEL